MDKITSSHIVEVDELKADDLDQIIDRLRAFPDDDFVVGRQGRGFAAFVSPRKFAHMAVQIRNQGTAFDQDNVLGYTLKDFKRDLSTLLNDFERGPMKPVMIMPEDDATDTVAALISIGSTSAD
jgi:hypothetical protein